MVYKLLFLFLFATSLFAQYGSEEVYNGGFETTGGWNSWGSPATRERSTEQAHTGTYSYKIVGDAGGGTQQGFATQAIYDYDLDITKAYRAVVWIYGDGINSYYVRVYRSGDVHVVADNVVIPATWTRYTTTVSPTGTPHVYHSYLTPASNGIFYNDDYSLRMIIDTLYIDSSMPDETDNDTTKTLTEAFETRGAHSGGHFIVSTGTYAESVTIDSSFAKLEASGTATITSVDFNSVTCTVDLANLTISTKLNDENVTYLNPPSTDESKGYDNYGGHRGYK